MTAPASNRPLRALVVDDSAVVRRFMSTVLPKHAAIDVETAGDALIAERKIDAFQPDVIVLDLVLPVIDGLTFLRRIVAERHIPVVVCSSLVTEGSTAALEALQLGAIDVIGKPAFGVQEFLEDSIVQLTDSLVAATQARRRPELTDSVAQRPAATWTPRSEPVEVVALGASTGGPQALEHILAPFSRGSAATLIVQHMPPRFTTTFATRLDGGCPGRIREACDGDSLEAGLALVAPGDRHLSVVRGRGGLCVRLSDGPLVSRHRPSVDVLFSSVAKAVGSRATGVLLTGMGDDGVEGLRQLRDAGAQTVAQSESDCIVYGMPKSAVRAGVAQHSLTTEEITRFLYEPLAAPALDSRPA